MGNYTFYISLAYGMFALLFMLNIIIPWRRHARLWATIKRQLKKADQHRESAT